MSLFFHPDADPEYYFCKPLKDKINGHTNRTVKLVTHLNAEGARLKWYKDGKLLSVKVDRAELIFKLQNINTAFRL